MFNEKEELERVKKAQFKLQIIGPLLYHLYPDKSGIAYARRVCETIREWPDGTPFNIHPDTILKWASDYKRISASETPETAGAAFRYLMGKERSDKGVSRALASSEAKARIATLLTEYPYINGVGIWEALRDEELIGPKVSVRSVQRYLKNQELTRGRELTAIDRRKFEAAQSGEVWQADTKHTFKITENGKTRKTYCIQIIDDHTRMIVGGGIFYADTAANFIKVLKEAVYNYGAPYILYTDHGGPYENKQLSLICGSIGTILKHPRVRDGAAKGKVERLHSTMYTRFFTHVKPEDITSLEQMNALYQKAVDEYNHKTHSSIMCAPIERYQTAPSMARDIPAEMIELNFLNRETRLVHADNTLKMFDTWFDVPEGFAGRKVEVRYVPGTTEGMFVYHNEKKYPIKKTNLVKNCHTPRKARPPIPAPDKKSVDYTKLTKNQTKDQTKDQSKDKDESSEPERKTSPAPSVFAASEQDVAKAKGKSRGKRRGD